MASTTSFAPDNGKTIVTGLALAVLVGVLLSKFFSLKMDPREPPLVPSKVPLIGHIIGMVQEGPQYLKRIGYVEP